MNSKRSARLAVRLAGLWLALLAAPAFASLPTSTVTFPTNGLFVNSIPSVTGSATAVPLGAANISSVSISILDNAIGKYWTGVGFTSSPQVFSTVTFVGASSGTWFYSNGALTTSWISGHPYVVQSKAVDSLAQTESPLGSVSFTFDNTPPVSAIVNPQNGANVIGNLPVLSGTAADAGAGVAAVVVRISSGPSFGTCWNGGSWGSCASGVAATGTAAWLVTAGSLPSGANLVSGNQYKIVSSATDLAGNTEAGSPPVVVNYYSFGASGSFATGSGALLSSGNGQHELGYDLAIDTVTSGGPYFYEAVVSTTSIGFGQPYIELLMKLDSGGNPIGQPVPLPGTTGDTVIALDGAGNVYVADRGLLPGGPKITLTKFNSSLSPLATISLDTTTIGNLTDMTSDGAFLYTINDGGPSLHPKIIKYDTNLVAVATATYTNGSVQDGDAIALDSAGEVFAEVTSTSGAVRHLIKWSGAIGTWVSPPAADTDISAATARRPTIAAAPDGSKVYVASYGPGPGVVYVQEYLGSNLAYSGVTSTTTGSADPIGLGAAQVRTAADGTVFLSYTDAYDGPTYPGHGDYIVMKFDANLNFQNSHAFNGPTGSTDTAVTMAVIDSSNVVVTGGSRNGAADFDAATVRMNLFGNPGGQVFAQATSLTTSSAPVSAANLPMLRVGLWAQNGPASLNTLTVGLTGNAPASNIASVALYADTDGTGNPNNGDGTFEAVTDTLLSSAAFSGTTPPQASLTIPTTTFAALGGTTHYFFLTVTYSGLSVGRSIGLNLPSPGSLGLSPGFPSGAGYPLNSGIDVVQQLLFANPSSQGASVPTPNPSVSGGFDTGLNVSPGQSLLVTATGTWNTGGFGATDATGLGSTGGLGAGLKIGSLVGRIGGGNWFQLSSSATVTAGQNGDLFLAMNDTSYADNTGSISVGVQVLVSTYPKVWTAGSGFNLNASINANWLNGQPPLPGDSVLFDGGASNANCNWDIGSLNLNLITLATSYTGVVTVGAGNQITLSSSVYVKNGILALGSGATLTTQGALEIQGGGFSMGPGGGVLQVSKSGIDVVNGGAFVSTGAAGAVTVQAVNPNDGFGFRALSGTAFFNNNSGTSFQNATGLVVGSSATVSLKYVSFSHFQPASSADVVFNTPNVIAPVSFSFSNLSFDNNTFANIDATNLPSGSTVTVTNASGPRMGSPFDTDPYRVIVWSPDGGGTGAISGTITNAGTGAGPVYVAFSRTANTGSMTAFDGAVAGASTTITVALSTTAGGYTLSGLAAPNTYYLLAWRTTNGAQLPQLMDPIGGYSFPGLLFASPVYVAAGAHPTNANITIRDRSMVSGTVTNNSAQFGTIVVQAWNGVPHSSDLIASTTLGPAAAGGGTLSYSFGVPAADGVSVGTTNLYIMGYVDVNGNGTQEPFEAQATSASVTALALSTVAVSLNITGGTAAAGGIVTVSSQASVHPGFVGTAGPNSFSLPQALLKFSLAPGGQSAAITSLRVDVIGTTPASAYQIGVWRDDLSNGIFDSSLLGGAGPFDSKVGETTVSGGVSSGVVVLSEFLPASSTTTYFVTLNLLGQTPAGPVAVEVSTSNSFGLSQGAMALQPIQYPLVSSPADTLFASRANWDAFEGGYGGEDSGLRVYEGQSFDVFSHGLWSPDSGAATTPDGRAGTLNEATIVPEALQGQLIARIDDGQGGGTDWFPVTSGVSNFADVTGEVFLAMNDFEGAYFDNTGAIYSSFTVTGSTTVAIQGTITYMGTDTASNFTVTAGTTDPTCPGCPNAPFGPVATMTLPPLSAGTTSFTYSFDTLPPGPAYVVQAYLQDNPNQKGNSGLPVDAQTVGSTVTGVDFTLSLGVGGINGVINYAGVQSGGKFYVAVTTTTDFGGNTYYFGAYSGFSSAYNISNLPTPNTFYMVGFRDVNGDGQPDGPEPFGVFGVSTGAFFDLPNQLAPIFLDTGATLGSQNLTMVDRAAIAGSVQVSSAVQKGSDIAVLIGHGNPLSDSFQPEDEEFIFNDGSNTNGAPQFFTASLLRPATDYSVLAFVDVNNDGFYDPTADASGLFLGPLNVPAGGFANASVVIAGGSVPPPPVTGFAGQPGSGQVVWTWNLSPGATSYQLRNSTGGVVTVLGPNASNYADALAPSAPSAIVSITASNGFGVSGAAGAVQLAALPVLPGVPSPSAVFASSAALTWTSNGNSGGFYQLSRATAATGPFFVSTATPSAFVTDVGLSPATPYFYKVRALNINGAATVFTATGSLTTQAPSGPSILGVADYAGTQGPRVLVQAYGNAASTGPLFGQTAIPPGRFQPYYLTLPANATYYVRAFVDAYGDGAFHNGVDFGQFSSTSSPTPRFVGVSPVVITTFTLSADVLPPATPFGLTASAAGVGLESVSWQAPTANADGTPLFDLAGYRVQRGAAAGGPFTTIASISSATAVFLDTSAAAGSVVYYRVAAVDLAGNAGAFTNVIAAQTFAGGTISGTLNYIGTTTQGPFRVRLSTTPFGAFTAETTVSPFSFTGLSDGLYYVRAFRDLNGDSVQQDSEPGGALGGIAEPYQIPIFGGTSNTGATLTVCDRTPATFAGPGAVQAYPITISGAGCPAQDQGGGYSTSLLSFRAGGGAAGSVGVGSAISIQMQSAFPNRLILLGPDGSVIYQDARPGGARIDLTVPQAGQYLIEPTSFNPNDGGAATVTLSVNGGFNGRIAGTLTYSGAQTGQVVLQLFNNTSGNSFPVFQTSTANPGNYAISGLSDGTYYLRAFRDSNGDFTQEGGEAAGSFGVSASTLTPIQIQGGVASVNGTANAAVNVTLTDPAVGSITGQILRQGSQTGTIRVEVGQPQVNCTNCSTNLVTFTTIAAAGPFTVPFVAAATNYVVTAYVDVNGNAHADPLEAQAQISPVSVQPNSATSVNLVVSDPGSGASGNASISGAVSYAGASTGSLIMGFATDANFQNIAYVLTQAGPGSFLKTGVLGNTSYYIAAFLDTNNNGEPDDSYGEPIGFYGSSPSNDFNSKQPVFVSTGLTVANVTMLDASTGSISGQVTYNGTQFAGKTLVVHGYQMSGNGHDQRVYIPNVVTGQVYNYTLPFLSAATNWNVSAFVDANGNGNQDFSEPSGFFGSPTCAAGSQCFGQAITVSTGPGTFPTYGVNVTINDPGQGNTSSTSGSIDVNAGYIGSQSGPIVGRIFTNSSYSGTPFKTITIPMPPGPGQFDGQLSGIPYGTYYVDAFRDPSGTGIYNPVFDAYGQLGSVTLSSNQNGSGTSGGASVVDPGQGGSVNVYSGSFTAVGGSRFDGGAVDIGVTVNVDTVTAGGPFVFVQGVTKQNAGIVSSLVKYSSAGVFLASATLPTPDTMIGLPAIDNGGNIFVPQDIQSNGVSSGTIVKFSPSLAVINTLIISSYTNTRKLAYADGKIYAAIDGSGVAGNPVLRVYDTALNAAGSGSYSFPAAAFPGCPSCTSAGSDTLAVGPGGVVYVVVKSQSMGSSRFYHLLKFPAALGAPVADVDITGLIPNGGNSDGHESLVADSAGNVFLGLIPNGDSSAHTYKFNSALTQVGSTSFGPLVSHFGGGLANLSISTDDFVYEAWESPAHGGDFLALRYDDNLNLVSSRTFDGLDNAHEDFAFGLTVQNSSNVYLTGAATNVNGNLDWATVRLNMNASGAASGAGAVVTITTSNATNAVFGTLSYTGVLATSGTVRSVLLPVGSATPIRLSSAPFAASVPYLFNNVPPGAYQVQAFIDGNGNLAADAGEPVGFSTSTGFQFAAAGNVQLNVRLCDRRAIAVGATLSDTITPADCPASDRGGASQRLYTFSGSRGQAVTIEMDAVNFYDTYLNLYDPSMNLAASDDDGAGAGNARITNFLLPADGLYTIGASPFAAGLSSATYKLSLSGSAGSLGSLAGTVTYSGAQGGAVFVGLFSSSSFNNALVAGTNLPGPGAFSFSNLKTGATYYLGAFIDVNGNGNPDGGEDVGVFGSTAAGAAPIFLRSGQNIGGITFPIVAASSGAVSEITGVVTYATATQSGSLHVQFFSNSAFSGQPVSERVLPAVGSYDVPLPPRVPYYIRAYVDANANGSLDATEPSGVYAPRGQGAEAVFASTGVIAGINVAIADPGNGAAGLSGAGTATITPATAAAGNRVFTATITFTAAAGGIATGGRVGFTVPPGFSPPQFVTRTSTSAATLSAVTFSGGSAISTVTAGTLQPGENVVFVYDLASVPCSLSTATFSVSAAQNAATPFLALFAGSPALQVVPGPVSVLQPANPYFSLLQGALSDPQSLEAHDACGNKSPLTSPLTATLTAKRFDIPTSSFLVDPTVGLSSTASVSTSSVLSVPFAVGQSSSPFFAIATSTGAKNLEVVYNLGTPATFYYGMTALPAGALSNASVSTVSFAAGSSSATITPNGDGVADIAYFNFTMADPTQPWHIAVASSPFKTGALPTPVWESWGQGQPLRGAIAWDGRFSPWLNGGARVPSGFYYVRVELGGSGVHDDSLIVNVSVPQISGHFYDAGVIPNPPLSGASVSIYGPNGTLSTLTDASGAYVLPGVVAGSYNMFVSRQDFLSGSLTLNVTAAGTVSTFTALSSSSGTINAAGGLDVLMSRSSVLLVAPSFAVGTSTAAADLWGGLQVQSSTSAASPAPLAFSAPLHVAAGTTTFDDGGQWDSSVNAFVAHTLFRFAVAAGTYTVSANLPGVAPSTASVYVGAGVVTLNLPPFVRKSSVSGLVTLPAGSNNGANGVFVSVNAVPLSTSTLLAGSFGGVQLPQGVLSGTYTVSGLDAGTYILRGNVQGLAAISTGPVTILASSDVAHVDFPAFSAGASITGTITVQSTLASAVPLNVSAWAPGSLNFGSTSVFVGPGVNPSAAYSITGLSAGTTYQVFANVQQTNNVNYFVPGGMPILSPAPAAVSFSFVPSSGVIAGTLILPAGSTDFLDVSLNGVTLASAKPDDVGRTFGVATSTNLPNFKCTQNGSTPASGYCPVGNSSATFTVQGENTETLAITFYDAATGQTAKKQLSVINGATTTVVIDLSAPTFSISGAINNQVTNALFNTNPNLVANAPFIAPIGYPAGLSSSTARVEAVLIPDITQFNAAISTSFNPAATRVGFLTAAGTFTVTNLPSGSYVVRTVDLRSCATCAVQVPAVSQTVSVAGAPVSNVNFTLSDGFTVSGAITLDGGLLDAQTFQVTVFNQRQEVVRSTTVSLGDTTLGLMANSVSYSFANIPANGFYTLTVTGTPAPSKYAGAPVKFPNPSLSPSGLQSNLSAQNVTMLRAAMIVGRLQDANTGTQIGAAQASLLAPNFTISATANPWTDGGFVVAASSVAGRPIQGDGYFRVGPLLPNVTYDLKLTQTAWDPAFLLLGSQNYAPVTVSGLTPQPGETRDVGVISLNQGQSLTGTLRAGTTSGALLGGIEIDAQPAVGASGVTVQTFTNPQGRYTLWVSTFISNTYNLTAAPRAGANVSSGTVYGQAVLNNVNLLATTTADFVLAPLVSVVTGQVVVADAATGGQLSYPFGANRGFPAAALNLQPQGVVPQVNPLGDITSISDQLGAFSVPGLSTGAYSLRATSLGYAVFNATVAVSTGGYHLFTVADTPPNQLPGNVLTLQRGATLTGRIVKSDGSSPNDQEVGGVAAANFAAGEFVIGSVDVDKTAHTVNSYTISGFKTGVSYSIVVIPADKTSDMVAPPEGSNVSFASVESTTTKNLTLTFVPPVMDCVATSKALGNGQFQIKVDCTKSLRALNSNDSDLSQLITVSTSTSLGAAVVAPNGTGQFLGSDKTLSQDRREMTAIYRSVANEASFSIRVRAFAAAVDPKTGANFSIDKIFDFYTGLGSNVNTKISNINGGTVALVPSGNDDAQGLDERSTIVLQPGTFAAGLDTDPAGSAVAAATTTVNVGLSKAQTQQAASALFLRSLGYVPSAVTSLGNPSAFPAETWAAMQKFSAMTASTSTVGGANPLSSFYSIFLPAGIRHQLKQQADITFSYSTALSTSTNPNNINVWFYNATLGKFVLENTNRRLDTTAKTITVAVNHFSVFVVLDGAPVVSVPSGAATQDIVAYNFPNPSDCIVHSNVNRDTHIFGAGATFNPYNGTMIRYSLPPGGSDTATIRIYSLSGELVRTIDQGAVSGATTSYFPWACDNQSGKTVASGVYIGEIQWGNKHKYFKIAIVKGSGL